METTVLRRPTSFRLSNELLDALKTKAAECNRSLNNYVECILLSAVSADEPNEITLSSIAEAKEQAQAYKQGKLINTTVDTSSVDAMLTSMDI